MSLPRHSQIFCPRFWQRSCQRPWQAAVLRGLRLLCLLFGCLLLGGGQRAHAQAAAPGRAAPAQIKADLDRILSSPEFQPPPQAENFLTRARQWFENRWDSFKRWLRGLWDRLFGPMIGGGSQALMYLLILAMIVLLAFALRQILRNLAGRKRGRDAARSAFDEDEPEADRITEPNAWLQQAERLAAAGDYRRAFRAVFVATLLQLERGGAIRYDRARTNGDYLRMLRSRERMALYEALRPLVFAFDARWYGDHATTEADYRRHLEAYQQIRSLIATTAGEMGSNPEQTPQMATGKA